MRRIAAKIAAAVVLLVVALVGAAYVYARRSLPLVNGSVRIGGLAAAVDIVRDRDAIPHIFAANRRDALFGLGYVHAQDRLWQMEFQRRIGFGRLSEIFGAATLPQDRFLRTVGFGRAARAAWDRSPAWAREQVDAYLAGINAFISTHHGSELPPEFSLLRFEPEPFTGPDVYVWVKMMAWDLSANYSFELLRDDLVRAVGEPRMRQLMPPYPMRGLSITARSDATEDIDLQGGHGRFIAGMRPAREPVASSMSALVSALSIGNASVSDFLLGNARVEALGSNNWVVDGTLTATGKPMLANDPHLSAKTPSTWYLAHVSGGDLDIIGATLPGAPAVAIGRNRFIAWGETNVAADVEDLFRERIDPTGRFVEYRGAQEPITTLAETIAVKGGAPVNLTVRITRHGPLISDGLNAINAASTRRPSPPPLEPLAFRWTALDDDDTTLQSFLKLNVARNWSEFAGALREFVVPSQNFVYADVEGHIGYYAPGHVPLRASGDGSRPSDGWTGDGEWTGWVPFEELPHLYDPPDHFIVTANHRPAPANYPYNLGLEWVEPYRAQRIVDLLKNRTKLTPDDLARIQADTLSLHAQTLRPLLVAHARPDAGAESRAVSLLAQWDGSSDGSRPEPAIFAAWFHELAATIAGDELGPVVTAAYAGRFTFITRFVINTLQSNDARWCDDVRTEKKESCDDAVTMALRSGIAKLAERMGGNLETWRWETVHRAMFPHQGLDAVGALRPLLSRSVPNGGDWATVNVGPVAADQLYEQHSVPGYRQIVDLSPANDSRFLDAVGESGHVLSPHYDDFLADWHAVRHRRMRMDRAEIEKDAAGRLRLEPQ